MYKALKNFINFSSMVSNRVLKELCYVAQLDFWKEDDFPGYNSYKYVYAHVIHVYKEQQEQQSAKAVG